MFKLPTSASLKARMATRKRGVSIENVMLGLIVVLIFAGLLYGAFTVVQRYIAKNTAQRVMPMASSEARLLYRNQPDFATLDEDELIAAGAIPLDSIQGGVFTLPFGGEVVFGPAGADTTRFQAVVTWNDPNNNAVALCTTMAAGADGALTISGPMGSEYTVTDTCDGASSVTVTAVYERG